MTRFDPLSDRDKVVLEAITHGATDREIAEGLGTTMGNVRRIISRKLLVRFKARNRTALTRKVLTDGVLQT